MNVASQTSGPPKLASFLPVRMVAMCQLEHRAGPKLGLFLPKKFSRTALWRGASGALIHYKPLLDKDLWRERAPNPRSEPASKLASFFAEQMAPATCRVQNRGSQKLASYENGETTLWNQRLTEGKKNPRNWVRSAKSPLIGGADAGVPFGPRAAPPGAALPRRTQRVPRGRRAGQGAGQGACPTTENWLCSVIFIRVGDRPPVMDASFLPGRIAPGIWVARSSRWFLFFFAMFSTEWGVGWVLEHASAVGAGR